MTPEGTAESRPLVRGLPKRAARRGRRFARGQAHPAFYVAAMLLVGSLGASAVYLIGSASRRSDRALLLDYEETIFPHAQRGGQLVQQEIKPSVNGFDRGSLPPKRLIEFAQNWDRIMREVRADFSAATPPSFLGDVEQRWTRAFDGYLDAIRLFASAARATGAERESLYQRAIGAAERADDLYDQASAVLQGWRRRLGLPPTSRFPDPEALESGLS